ncbi:hypothetical protein AVEN_171620-1 [Araneus ventricosus]|uniref:Uncharacterized protein n=1 Tax=Araneus ventricosus TaxID=182803 RepID=A0A4Y2F232_ARAVE|nr:hypothetical protein AVEN_171620-1 [Araneus ventricosus]
MEEIYSYFDEKDDCQYFVDELMEQISGEKSVPARVRQKMKANYRGRIVFSTVSRRKIVVCFHDVSEKVLNDTWYISKSINEKKHEKESFESMV